MGNLKYLKVGKIEKKIGKSEIQRVGNSEIRKIGKSEIRKIGESEIWKSENRKFGKLIRKFG